MTASPAPALDPLVFSYEPDEGEGWVAEVAFSKAGMPRLLGAELLTIERHYMSETGIRSPWPEIFQECSTGAGAALLTVLWVLRKRSVPTLRFDDFAETFDIGYLVMTVPDNTDDDESAGPKDEPAASAPAKKRSPKAS